MDNMNVELLIQKLLNRVATLEYQNALLDVENDELKAKLKTDKEDK